MNVNIHHMDTTNLKAALARLHMPVDSLVVLQPDPERDNYDLLHVITDAGLYKYDPTTGELMVYEVVGSQLQPCRVLLGGSDYHIPAIRLGTLMRKLDSVPEKVVMMPNGSVKVLTGVSRDLFKISQDSVEVYYREDNNDDYVDEDILNGGPGVLVAECVVLY